VADEKLAEKITPAVQRCPKCQEISLTYDVKTSRLYCTRCGFEQHLAIGGKK